MDDLLAGITVPTLLLDEAKCRANFERMADRAKRHGLQFRPHAKTHQSRAVARWSRDYGVEKLTVSSLRMAAYFADDGWTDITVAFPTNIREADRIRHLASRVALNLLVESVETVEALDAMLSSPVGIFIKADTGYGRTGLKPGHWDRIDPIVERIRAADRLHFRGFLCHAGHSYAARSPAEIEEVHDQTLKAMAALGHRYSVDTPDLTLSIGDTPSCSVAEHFEGVHEMRPGNFAFYDLDQLQIGACSADDIAIALACPVVALHPDRLEAVLYGGGVHLSTERQQQADGTIQYGMLGVWEETGWSLPAGAPYLRKISQEHGVVRFFDEATYKAVRLGELVPVLPVHSCMTADAMGAYLTLEGESVAMMGGYPGL